MSRGNGAARLASRALFLLALSTQAWGHEEGQPYAAWYNSLSRADGGMCCSISDCRTTEFRVRDAHYEAWIDERYPGGAGIGWAVVPDEAILQNKANPTGEAVACFYSGAVRCFVRPLES